MFVVGGLLAGLGSLAIKLLDAPALIGVGLSLMMMDAVMRLRARAAPRWLLSPSVGGHVWYAAMWGIGVLVSLINLARVVMG